MRCDVRVFKANDSVPDTEPEGWFMWMTQGPNGPGWYRDNFVKTTRNWPIAKAIVVASVKR